MGNILYRVLSFALCVLPGVVSAQTMFVSEGIPIRNDYGYELIGRLRDRILLFRDKFDDFEVQAYDNQMHLSWTRGIDDIDKKGVQILSVVGSKNDFSVIHKLRRRNHSVLRIHKYDPGANLIDSMTVKDYGERVFSTPVLDIVRSDDKNCFVVFNTAERNKLELTCFRLDKMQVLWDKTVTVDEQFYESGMKAMALSNNGEFFLVNERNNRRAKIEEHEFLILRTSGKDEELMHIPLTEYLTNDMRFTFDNHNHRLVAAGLFMLALSFAAMVTVGYQTPMGWLLAWVVLGRIGLGFILPSLNLGAMRGLPGALIPQGASAINFLRMLGGAAGVALCGVALEWRFAVHGPTLTAFNEVFVGLAALCALALIAALRMREADSSTTAAKE